MTSPDRLLTVNSENQSQPGPHHRLWRRLQSLVFILFCLEMGIVLALFPWSALWERNYFFSLAPRWTEIFFSSYLRDITHAQPIHPETLEYLTRASGFANVSIRYSAPVAEHTRLKQIDLPAEILNSTDQTARAIVDAARVVNVNAGILNNLAFSYQDYAVTGYRS